MDVKKILRGHPEKTERLMQFIKKDFGMDILSREDIRNIFKDLGCTETEIFGMMELLGLERGELRGEYLIGYD